MEQKLDALIERLVKDVNSMPWLDRGLPPAQLKNSVEFFIRAFKNDAKELIKQERQKCEQISNALDFANTPQANSDLPDSAYQTEHVAKAVRKIRKIIKGEEDGNEKAENSKTTSE